MSERVEVRRIQRAGGVERVLADAGIPCHLHASHLRTLLAFFGPFAPVIVLVPESLGADAGRALAGVLGADARRALAGMICAAPGVGAPATPASAASREPPESPAPPASPRA